MTPKELIALESAMKIAFESMSNEDIHRMLTEQNSDVRSCTTTLP